MLIDSFKEKLLKQRGLGVFPREADAGAEDLLVKVLVTEYQIIALNAEDDSGSLLSKAAELVHAVPEESLERSIALLNYAHLLVLSQDYQTAIKVLSDTSIETSTFSYVQSLIFKKFYLLGVSLKATQDPKTNEVILQGINHFKHIPNASQVESNKWLNLLFDQLSINSIPELQAAFKSQNFVLRYLLYKRLNLPESQDFITNKSQALLKSASFPSSNESNNVELEEFLELVASSDIVKPSVKRELLEQGIAKTYQSQVLLCSLAKTLIQIGDFNLLKSSFEVYIDYVESFYVLNNHSYKDIISVLSLHNDLLSNPLRDLDFKKAVLSGFKKLLQNFYEINGISTVDQDVDIFKAASSSLTPELALLLSQYWFTVGSVTFEVSRESKLISEDLENLNSSLTYYRDSIYLCPQSETIFQYALKLAILRDYKLSYTVLKLLLKTLQSTSITYFKSFHLLALILSIEENKEESFKIISFIKQEVEEYIGATPVVPIPFKTQFIEIEISRLGIIESLYGIEQTLDSLSGLFNLYNQLFGSSKRESPVQPTVTKTHKPSRSINSTTLANIRSKKEPQPKQTPKPSTLESKILQKIWLLSAIIYAKLELYRESEEAIIEAENTLYPTHETHAILGLITSTTRPKFALEEFEISLSSKLSLSSIVGFSNLILSDSSIFIDDKDKLAGIARTKLLLETIVETFEGAYSSEVWWLLSLIYEKFGDEARLKKSLWKSVELEESRPVRDFSVVET